MTLADVVAPNMAGAPSKPRERENSGREVGGVREKLFPSFSCREKLQGRTNNGPELECICLQTMQNAQDSLNANVKSSPRTAIGQKVTRYASESKRTHEVSTWQGQAEQRKCEGVAFEQMLQDPGEEVGFNRKNFSR